MCGREVVLAAQAPDVEDERGLAERVRTACTGVPAGPRTQAAQTARREGAARAERTREVVDEREERRGDVRRCLLRNELG